MPSLAWGIGTSTRKAGRGSRCWRSTRPAASSRSSTPTVSATRIDLEEWGDLEVDFTDPPEDWAETLERDEAARGTASKDPDDPAGSGRSPRLPRGSDDAGEDDEDENEPDD